MVVCINFVRKIVTRYVQRVHQRAVYGAAIATHRAGLGDIHEGSEKELEEFRKNPPDELKA